jgi:hypothetical protein
MLRLRIASLVVGMSLTLSGCATAQMHSDEQLNSIAQGCGLSFGEIMQDESEKRLLFLMRPGASRSQRGCVLDWARRNHLRLVIVNIAMEPRS